MGLFHIIEWVRTGILLALTGMGGVRMMLFYEITAVNYLFGFVAYVYAHYAYFGATGVECRIAQPTRSQFLLAEVIFFYVIYGLVILFVLSFPKVAFELAHGGWRKRKAGRA